LFKQQGIEVTPVAADFQALGCRRIRSVRSARAPAVSHDALSARENRLVGLSVEKMVE